MPSNLHENSKKLVLEDPGSGHRALMLSISFDLAFATPSTHTTWYFKKANWTRFQEQVEIHINNTDLNDSPHKNLKSLCDIMVTSAKLPIPRGKQTKYKPLWTKELSLQKSNRDSARKKAENTRNPEDVLAWRK